MPLPTAAKPWSFYRLGLTREKGLFKRRRDTYDGVVVSAHIASYYSSFCAGFVGSLRCPYFIDPITYIFANPTAYLKRFIKDKTGKTQRNGHGRKRKGDLKRSYSKLVEHEYQSLVKMAVDDDRPLLPADFQDTDSAEEFVGNVLRFQKTRLAAIPDKYRKYEKYTRQPGEGAANSLNLPMCLVAPYFLTTTLNPGGWHHVNLQLLKISKVQAEGLPVFAVILAGTQLLDKHVKQMVKEYLAAGADGFLFWPDGFSGDQVPAALRIVYDSVEQLSVSGKPVILLYGDALSLALHYAGLAGFACAICYGERKFSTQDTDVEGSIPTRYYISKLKKKMVIETELRRIQLADYPDLGCGCDICQRKPDPATLDDTEASEHFMLARAKEIAELRSGLTKEAFAAALDETSEHHAKDPLLQPIGHLRNWSALLR